MASLWLKSLLFVLTISYVCSAIVKVNGVRPELPRTTNQDNVDKVTTNDGSGGQIESDLPDVTDEATNQAKWDCLDECEMYLIDVIYHQCWLACRESKKAELLE